MPSRKHRYDAIRIAVPWVDGLEDRCLREIVIQAFEARRKAIETNGKSRLIAAADHSLEQIEFGRVSDKKAWQLATAALRKFDQAWMMPDVPGTRRG